MQIANVHNAVVMLYTREKAHRLSWWLQIDEESENRKRKDERIYGIIKNNELI